MREDIAACAAIVEKGDPDRFRATMAAPVALRDKLFPLYAFNVEVARAPWLTEEPMIAEMRLQWWRDALEEIRAGGPVRRHEVTTPLAEVIDAEGVNLLDQLIAARRWDIYKEPFEDTAHFQSYLKDAAGNLLAVALRSTGTQCDTLAREFGYAQGVANWLRAVPNLEAAGRIPLVDGRPETVGKLAHEGLQFLHAARANKSSIPKQSQPALLPLWQTSGVLKRAARSPAKVGLGQLEVSPFRQNLGLLKATVFGI
ncbi:Squalene/phytoene synthase [Roseovarius albus]|uniref:Squalene/phytoene synthase n=1 Tax=Roseovarius albus TaxID=1247867 RepID=A0A1X6ZBM6_9RHOB|nr:squalene/phytoene synthase family protein [Roseovarius albus]SLN46447.1 Squalene/phytoene synthase [Roseovarius albus]